MNEIVTTLLSTRDGFMPEMDLRQPGFTYSACGSLKKTKEESKNLKKQEVHDIFIKTNQIKLVFHHDMAYGGFKDLTRRTACDKILHDKAFNITKNSKYDGYQRVLLQWLQNFYDKENLWQWY